MFLLFAKKIFECLKLIFFLTNVQIKNGVVNQVFQRSLLLFYIQFIGKRCWWLYRKFKWLTSWSKKFVVKEIFFMLGVFSHPFFKNYTSCDKWEVVCLVPFSNFPFWVLSFGWALVFFLIVHSFLFCVNVFLEMKFDHVSSNK